MSDRQWMLFGFGVCCLAIPAGVAFAFLLNVMFRSPEGILTIVGTAAIVASRLIGRKVEP